MVLRTSNLSYLSLVLQIGRSLVRFQMVLLEFFIDIIPPIALWPWGRLSLWQKLVPGAFPGGKGGRCVRLTTLPPSCAVVMQSEKLNFLEPSESLQACNGTALPLPFFDLSHFIQTVHISYTYLVSNSYRRAETVKYGSVFDMCS
jgi:hypothetical protein